MPPAQYQQNTAHTLPALLSNPTFKHSSLDALLQTMLCVTNPATYNSHCSPQMFERHQTTLIREPDLTLLPATKSYDLITILQPEFWHVLKNYER